MITQTKMNSPQQALAKAANTTSWAVGMCDQFVASMFGFGSSGYATAIANWDAVPSTDKHPGDTNAPAGALMFWGGSGDGHVAISNGNGSIYSTDISGDGTVSLVPSSRITQLWGLPYLGWSDPYFQGNAGYVGSVSSAGTTTATQASATSSLAGSAVSAFFDSLVGDTGAASFKDAVERFGLILLGAIFIVVGVLRITSVRKAVSTVKNSHETGLKTSNKAIKDTEDSVA